MKKILLIVILLFQGCASVGPILKECTMVQPTELFNAVLQILDRILDGTLSDEDIQELEQLGLKYGFDTLRCVLVRLTQPRDSQLVDFRAIRAQNAILYIDGLMK